MMRTSAACSPPVVRDASKWSDVLVPRSRRYLALSFPPPLTPVPPHPPLQLHDLVRVRSPLRLELAQDFRDVPQRSLLQRDHPHVRGALLVRLLRLLRVLLRALLLLPVHQAPRDAEHERLAQEFRRRAQGLVLRHHRYLRLGLESHPPPARAHQGFRQRGRHDGLVHSVRAHGDADAQAPERRVGLGRVLELLRQGLGHRLQDQAESFDVYRHGAGLPVGGAAGASGIPPRMPTRVPDASARAPRVSHRRSARVEGEVSGGRVNRSERDGRGDRPRDPERRAPRAASCADERGVLQRNNSRRVRAARAATTRRLLAGTAGNARARDFVASRRLFFQP